MADILPGRAARETEGPLQLCGAVRWSVEDKDATDEGAYGAIERSALS